MNFFCCFPGWYLKVFTTFPLAPCHASPSPPCPPLDHDESLVEVQVLVFVVDGRSSAAAAGSLGASFAAAAFAPGDAPLALLLRGIVQSTVTMVRCEGGCYVVGVFS